MTVLAFLVVAGFSALAIFMGWYYFRRYALTRPAIGVYSLEDIALMLAFIVLVPFIYLWLPLWVAVGLMVLASSSILYYTFEPIFRRRAFVWLGVGGFIATDFLVALLAGSESNLFLGVNNLLLIILVAGLSNLWAQSGMKARDAAVLGVFWLFMIILLHR